MIKCWMSKIGKIETENGSTLKVKTFKCPHALTCLDYFSTVVTQNEKMTRLGMLMDPNPVGPDLMLKFLRARCHHPQKHRICMHIASLPAVGILVPNHILDLIEKAVVCYES